MDGSDVIVPVIVRRESSVSPIISRLPKFVVAMEQRSDKAGALLLLASVGSDEACVISEL